MTVKEIVKKYLEENGYDGLGGGECSCKVSGLLSCDSPNVGDCEAGYIHERGKQCKGCDYEAENCIWCIRVSRP